MVQTQTLRAEAWKAIKEEKRPVVYTLDEPEKDDRNNLSLSQGNLANDKARVDLMQNRGKRLEAALTKQLDEKLLKQEPLNNRLIVDAIGVITSSWKEHYAKPCPEDLVKLMSDVGDLAEYCERKAKEARTVAVAYPQLVKRNEEMIVNHPVTIDSLSQKVTELENRRDNAKINIEAAKMQKEAEASAPPSVRPKSFEETILPIPSMLANNFL
ncbi:hypothetical protein OsJ_21223 [Oryza sativa Japonica Group]|uniref:Uncharacterized protein n=1 Tax=Oryza sativa subsp. japonica TaxID=39947 RepID=A3BBE1_ORYSJ|nr:hypothetical protein OsJ_21223 [Oryza sativa Japonica Group]